MKICISGLTGSGKTTLGDALAKELGIEHVKPTYKSATKTEDGLIRLLETASVRYIKDFDRDIVAMARGRDCVITTWHGPWIIRDATVRVWLLASLEERARRIAKRGGKDMAYCERHIKEKDRLTMAQYRRAYGKDFDLSVMDLQMNYERMEQNEAVAAISMLALSRDGKNFV